MAAYFRRVGMLRGIVTLALLGIMLDTVWTGKTGEGCKSMLQDDVHIGIVHTGH